MVQKERLNRYLRPAISWAIITSSVGAWIVLNAKQHPCIAIWVITCFVVAILFEIRRSKIS